MKCPNCGAPMGLEDEVCPYCGKPNTMAVQHQSDMAHYRQEFERTQADVLEKTSFLQRQGTWLVVLVVLLACIIGGIALNLSAWDIGYSMRTKNVERTMVEDRQALDSYLQKGDYGQFLGYYDANDISFDEDKPYQGLHRAAYAYVDLLEYIWAIDNDSSFRFTPEHISDTCGYLAEDLNRIYTLEQYYPYDTDKFIPAEMRVYVEDIRSRAAVIAKAYFGLTDEDIREIPNMSTRKLATLIEEGIAK